jgi:hypothetical protein
MRDARVLRCVTPTAVIFTLNQDSPALKRLVADIEAGKVKLCG